MSLKVVHLWLISSPCVWPFVFIFYDFCFLAVLAVLDLAVCTLFPGRGERGRLLGCGVQALLQWLLLWGVGLSLRRLLLWGMASHCSGSSCGAWASHCGGSSCGAWPLIAEAARVGDGLSLRRLCPWGMGSHRGRCARGAWALKGSGRMGFGSCCTGGSGVVVHGLGCPEAREILVPRPGVQPLSPAFEGRFLTTGPPGMSLYALFYELPLQA